MRWISCLCLLAWMGCARGTIGEVSEDGGLTDGATGGGSTSGTNGGGGGMPSSGTSGSNGDAGATSGGTGTSGSASTGGTGANTGGTKSTTCTAPTTSCAAPTDLGEIAGNVDTVPPLTQSGAGPAWFKLTVVDDGSNGFVEAMMGLVAKLSKGGADYDLYVYKNGDTACAKSPLTSASATATEYIDHVWGTGGPTTEDPRTLIVEVRPSGTTCSDWTLTLEGHPCSYNLVFNGDTCAEAGRKPLHQ